MRVDNNTRNRCVFRKPAFVLAATVSIGLGTISSSSAQFGDHSYLVDLNTPMCQLRGFGG